MFIFHLTKQIKNLEIWIKRLARKTICFSKLEEMHDTVVGLLINKVEFGLDIYAKGSYKNNLTF